MTHVVLAGGGSAGHTSPLIATAERLLDHEGVTVSCVGTADKLEATVIPAAGLEIDFIDRVPMPRSLSLDLARVPLRLGKAISQARQILRRRQADVVVGFGGYVCPPVYLAARSLGIPFLVHEGNALPGMANKLGARFAAGVATSYPETPLHGARMIGLPLREAVTTLDRSEMRQAGRTLLGLPIDVEAHRPTLLVSGGSLGARSINTAVVEAREDLLARGIDIVHVWGKTNWTSDLADATDATTGAVYHPVPYVEDMTLAYAASDAMLCRAGSNTVFETAVTGLPAIFVPLPHGNGEQARNAAALVAAGGGLQVPDADLTADVVRTTVADLVTDPDRLARMGKAGQGLLPGNAAEELAAWVLAEVR